MGVVFFGGGKVGMAAPIALPSGYSKLAYIEGSGKQYVNTGLVAGSNTRIVMDFEITAKTGSTALAAWGARTNYSTKHLSFIYDLSGLFWTYNYGSTHVSVNASSPVGRYTIDANAGNGLFNGTAMNHAAATFTCAYNLYLFAINNAGTAQWMPYGRIYSCQIYENGTLIRDYVPCLSDTEGVGLFDLVNNKFYGNAGSGSFVGSEVA